jgi:hypothetical protein
MRQTMNVVWALATAVAILSGTAAAAAPIDLDGDWTRDDGKVYRIDGDQGKLLNPGEWRARIEVIQDRDDVANLKIYLRKNKGGKEIETQAIGRLKDPANPNVLSFDWGWVDVDDGGTVVERGTEPRTLTREPKPEVVKPPTSNPEAVETAFLDGMKKRVEDAKAKNDVAALRALGREVLKGAPGDGGHTTRCEVLASYAFQYAIELAPGVDDLVFDFVAACVLASEFQDAREAIVKLERKDQGLKDARGERVTEWIRRVDSIAQHYETSGRHWERAAQIEGKVSAEDHDAVVAVARREGDAYQVELEWFQGYFDPSFNEPK